MENIVAGISGFPEGITEDGLKMYGMTSYENQIALLSHYLHNKEYKGQKKLSKKAIISVILDYVEFKRKTEMRKK